jgi:hypothetical protein
MPTEPFDSGKPDELYGRFYMKVANGNVSAAQFIWMFHTWCHEIDDIIDDGKWDALSINTVLLGAAGLYAHPFYIEHWAALQSQIIIATSVYADSNLWEKDPALWKRQWAEVLRHSGLHINFTIAMICGGWEHLRGLGSAQLAMAYIYHADKHGVPS